MAYGYRDTAGSPRQIVLMQVDASTSTILANDPLIAGTAGYVQKAAANEAPIVGVAIDGCTAPSADGGKSIRVDVSPASRYEFPPDTGTVTQALVNTWVDYGGSQTINIDATTDKCFFVQEVNTTRNTVTGVFLSPIPRS